MGQERWRAQILAVGHQLRYRMVLPIYVMHLVVRETECAKLVVQHIWFVCRVPEKGVLS